MTYKFCPIFRVSWNLNKKGDGAVQWACTHFMTPGPEDGRNFFWWTIGVQNHQGTHQNWFLPFLGAPGGHFSKNPKMDVFQILNFPDSISQLPLDLESWNFFWYALTLCWTKCSIPLWLVWFGLVWSGIWSWFRKMAVLKKAVRKFLIFLA